MTLGERIKKVRKDKDLTQQEFCKQIGLKRNSISLVESGKRNISDQAIKSICREFHVNEEWLRTGNGDMFIPAANTTLEQLIQEYHLNDIEREIVTAFVTLDDKSRAAVTQYLRKVAAAVVEGRDERPHDELDIEAEVAAYRAHLLREKEAREKSSASGATG